MVDFTKLGGGEPPKDETPRAVFMRLTRDARFQFPRDIQTEVWNAWDKVHDRRDNVIKLNVGSGKMVVGLVILQTVLCPSSYKMARISARANRDFAHLFV